MTGKDRRTIMKGDAPSYSGPEQIESYYNNADIPILRTVTKGKYKVTAVQSCPYPDDSKRSFLTLWISGCREGEAVMLNPFQWKWNKEAILGSKLPVLKKRMKVKDASGNIIYKPIMQKVMQQDGTIRDQTIYRPMSKQKIEYRDHLMPIDIPLGQTFIDMIHNLQNEGVQYILFKRKRFTREIIKNQATSTRSVLSRITELHPDLFPHGIRALLARYMRDRYGDDFDAPELKELFKWSSGEMVTYYLSGQKLANKMGIKRLPS